VLRDHDGGWGPSRLPSELRASRASKNGAELAGSKRFEGAEAAVEFGRG